MHVEALANGRRQVRVELTNPDLFSPMTSCETSYPTELISTILRFKGPSYLCDEIMREESPAYVQKSLKYDLLGYVKEEGFENARVLDFGCGSGASTMVLARMFPRSEIVGVELEECLLSIAQCRASYYGYKNVRLLLSPNACSLPAAIGDFDFVVLSAVYEHLLPNERNTVLSQIWSILKPHGILFLNQTPHRFFPVEAHTTGLPLINYLPDKAAHLYACHFSRRKLRNLSWNALLRAGIRGGSVHEILGILTDRAEIKEPSNFGMKDRVDLYRFESSRTQLRAPKKMYLCLAKLVRKATGIAVLPYLSLAIGKRG